MLLFHGSNMGVERPRILAPARALDFGPGFYTTTSREQAERWAALTALRRGKGSPTLTVYDFDEGHIENLDVLAFPEADANWLDFVAANRKNTYTGKQYDLVSGPVANDRTMPVVNDYIAGNIDTRTALSLLMPQKLHDQIAFLSDAALSALKLSEVTGVGA